MTGEPPLAITRPPDVTVTMSTNSGGRTGLYDSFLQMPAHTSHPIIPPMMCKKVGGPAGLGLPQLLIVPDHSLQTDWMRSSVCSPGSSFMYETDPLDSCTATLLSPCASDALHSPVSTGSWKRDAWDQHEEEGLADCDNSTALWNQINAPPLEEYLRDLISDTDGCSLQTLGEELACNVLSVKTEDTQAGLKDQCTHGPTLAQLNDAESVLDKPLSLGPEWEAGRVSTASSQTASWGSTSLPVSSNYRLLTTGACTTLSSSRSRSAQQTQHIKSETSAPQPAETFSLKPRPGLHQLLSAPMSLSTPNKQELLKMTLVTKKAGAVPSQVSTRKRKSSGNNESGDSNTSMGSMERKWEEIRDYIDSNVKEELGNTGLAKVTSTSLPGTSRELEPHLKKIKTEPPDMGYAAAETVPSAEPAIDSDMDNSDFEDFSDIESDASYSSFVGELLNTRKKDKRYFWQYNMQSKGPKGKRLCKSMQEVDPHNLADFEDPVFQPDIEDAKYKHNGKARKGDGNDITPNPWKLFQIGNELQKLNKKINGIGTTKVNRGKDTGMCKSRKEKNKYASRACRLKKKAQHEANKVKLYGLEQEHSELMSVLNRIKRYILSRVEEDNKLEGVGTLTPFMEEHVKKHLTVMIAGNTTDYVTAVLETVAKGDKSGGIHPD